MPFPKRLATVLAAVGMALALAGCDPTRDLKDPPVDLGRFKLGHNIVVVPHAQALPGSRNVTPEEWKEALTKAIDDRFGRYDGDRVYHLGVSVDAYNLAPIDLPGVPTPKSALAITATIWDDQLGSKLNDKPKRILVLGVFSGAGIQPTREVQLANLSALAAKEIEDWLVENPQWFQADAQDDAEAAAGAEPEVAPGNDAGEAAGEEPAAPDDSGA